ncbi:TonB family protein [Longimicrobium sp.]|jgi:protein TonB|uniref:energy transducer TonB n=1 Tax=Longimicrobium sp. TaxID=2029185 RepID=UPI002F932B00
MFQILVREKKRRAISPLFLAVSAAAHVAIFGGVMYAASGEPERTKVVLDGIIDIPDVPEKAIEKPTVDPPPPAPDTPDEPAADAPVVGETVVLQPPTDVPTVISPPRADETPITPHMVTGIGKPGDVIGTPDPGDVRPPTGNTDPGTPVKPADWVPGEGDVDELPSLERNGLARLMERHYPPQLRDARVSGRALVEVIVDEDGRVRPGSAKVIETSHPGFETATLRAAERFRFRPAKIAGMVVPVKVAIPVVWTTSD